MIVHPLNTIVSRRFGLLLLLCAALPMVNAAEPPVLSEAVKDQVDQALAAKKVDDRLYKLAAVGDELVLSNIAPALAYAGGLKELRERVVFSQAVLSRWGRLAPEAAFVYIAGLPESIVKLEAIKSAAIQFAQLKPAAAAAATTKMTAGPARNQAGPLVADIWARTNVPQALAWAQSLPEDFPRETELHAIRFVWVHSDPVSAIPHVMALPADEVSDALLMNIGGEWAAFDPPAAWHWAQSLPPRTGKDLILENVVESWADTQPQPAIEFAWKLSDQPLRDRLTLAALRRWVTQNPAAAMQWLVQTTDDSFQSRGAAEVMKVWASAAPAEAAGWVGKLPAGTRRDLAIGSYIDAACDWDPAASLTLATQLSDRATRLNRIQQCLAKWLPRQPAAAKQWIDASDFDEALKTEWRKGNFSAGPLQNIPAH